MQARYIATVFTFSTAVMLHVPTLTQWDCRRKLFCRWWAALIAIQLSNKQIQRNVFVESQPAMGRVLVQSEPREPSIREAAFAWWNPIQFPWSILQLNNKVCPVIQSVCLRNELLVWTAQQLSYSVTVWEPSGGKSIPSSYLRRPTPQDGSNGIDTVGHVLPSTW